MVKINLETEVSIRRFKWSHLFLRGIKLVGTHRLYPGNVGPQLPMVRRAVHTNEHSKGNRSPSRTW